MALIGLSGVREGGSSVFLLFCDLPFLVSILNFFLNLERFRIIDGRNVHGHTDFEQVSAAEAADYADESAGTARGWADGGGGPAAGGRIISLGDDEGKRLDIVVVGAGGVQASGVYL